MVRNSTTQPEPKVPSARVVYADVARAPKYLSIAEVVTLTGFSRRSVQGWISLSLLRSVKVGRRRKISRDDVLHFLNARIEAGYIADNERRIPSKDTRRNAVARAAREALSIEIDAQLDADVYLPMADLRLALERAYAFGRQDGTSSRPLEAGGRP
ncbi:MAG: Helix-turn-helix domain [Pseudomonadota bacterium]|jgi:excisionase family DNA binding protein